MPTGRFVVLAAGGLFALVTACRTPPQVAQPNTLPPTMDRLLAAYKEDLANKRFEILADFEDPRQGSLFHRMPDNSPEAVGISTARAQLDTGVGALRMSLSNSSQRIVAADSPGGEWALFRDWSAYPLLLMSVFSPRDLGGFRFSVTSGTTRPLVYEHPRIFLKTGWNRIRIDLGEMAEHIYLGDVREMRFWCDPLDTPIELYLDDLILADNSRDLLVTPERRRGDLYVKAQGRRLVVGAVGCFTLVFSRGQICQWFDLSSDPGSLHDLTGAGSLGPTPVLLRDGRDTTVSLDDPAQWSQLGPLAESYQRVLEASPLRVVIHGEWRFGSPESPAGENSPYHRWVYSVYRDGRIYVECTGSLPPSSAGKSSVGMAFACDGSLGFQRKMLEGSPASGPPSGDAAGFVLFSRPQAGQADLLVVPYPGAPGNVRTLENPSDPRLCVLYHLPGEGDQFMFAGMICVWPTDVDMPAQAGPMAVSYTRPLPIKVDAGSLVRSDPGDFDNDGFSEARGYYVLQLDGRVATVRLDGRQRLRFSPVFKLVDVVNRDVWVYVDGRQIKNLERDANENAIFEIPGVISREVLIEITSTERAPQPEKDTKAPSGS